MASPDRNAPIWNIVSPEWPHRRVVRSGLTYDRAEAALAEIRAYWPGPCHLYIDRD